MAVMNRAQFPKELQEGLNAVFGVEYARHSEQWKDIFETHKEGKKAYVEDVLLVGLGGAQVKAEGSASAQDSMAEGWVSRYLFETISLRVGITEEALEDNLYIDWGTKIAKALARSFAYTKNVKGANILNNGFSASYPIGDGDPLFSTSHPLSYGGNGTNTLATAADLSETSLEDLLILMGDMVDDRGLPVAVKAKKLIVPNALQFEAQRILFSTLRSGTMDNDQNAIREMGLISGGFSVNNHLTDADAFFITTDIADGLKYIERKALHGGVEGDFATGNMSYKKRTRYVFGVSDWRGCVASPGI